MEPGFKNGGWGIGGEGGLGRVEGGGSGGGQGRRATGLPGEKVKGVTTSLPSRADVKAWRQGVVDGLQLAAYALFAYAFWQMFFSSFLPFLLLFNFRQPPRKTFRSFNLVSGTGHVNAVKRFFVVVFLFFWGVGVG